MRTNPHTLPKPTTKSCADQLSASPRSRFRLVRRLGILCAAIVLLVQGAAFGQGQLNPPGYSYTYPSERALNPSGAPVPSMKTLMQIDPGEHLPSRDPHKANLDGSLGYLDLNAPGRYYLTENVSQNILISSDDVTLDLCGFEIRYTGAGTGPAAIQATGGVVTYHRTKVMNGRIRGIWQKGIELGDDSVVSGVDIAEVANYGIKLGKSGHVFNSRVRGAWSWGQSGAAISYAGIYGDDATIVSQCNARGIGGIGIQVNNTGRVVDCTVIEVLGCAIVTNHGSSIQGCAVRMAGSTGYDLGQGCTLHNSAAFECIDSGVHVRNGCTVSNVTSRESQEHGFLAEPWTTLNPQYNKNATNFVNCVAQSNKGDGFHVNTNCVFTNCSSDENGATGVPTDGNGFYCTDHCRFMNCMASNNVLSGFRGNLANTIDQCTSSGNTRYGIEFASNSNVVIRNTLRGNVTATIQPAPGTGGIAPLQLPSAATPNPFANFSL